MSRKVLLKALKDAKKTKQKALKTGKGLLQSFIDCQSAQKALDVFDGKAQ